YARTSAFSDLDHQLIGHPVPTWGPLPTSRRAYGTCDGSSASFAVAFEEHVAVRRAKEVTERSSGLTSRLVTQQSVQSPHAVGASTSWSLMRRRCGRSSVVRWTPWLCLSIGGSCRSWPGMATDWVFFVSRARRASGVSPAGGRGS